MTSRPSMGVHRPPKRTLSNSSLSSIQRPGHQRSLSQQFLPVSPIRKDSSFLDFGPDPTEVAQNRYGNTPRRGGSRLKLELSSEAMLLESSPELSPSPQTLTPARIMPPEPTMPDSPQPLNLIEPGMVPLKFDRENPPMPFPKRRKRFTTPNRTLPPTATPIPALTKDGRPKPYNLEPPADAPAYHPVVGKGQGKGHGKAESMGRPDSKNPSKVTHGDFFPWLGTHPEDRFSDHVIRHGYFDKTPTAQTETASAKSTIYPALKHKSGLAALSNVFMSILQQRKQIGLITAPSTFKPPPRVTLTDTKRENWLRDLANPAITLRKLSRTIPHGIRGKGLLEQCMNKKVPPERAVWLARCVGANEIRASKRKGVNGTFIVGEVTWVREWTLNLERFLESIIFSFGDDEWRSKVMYATRLATSLYEEQLLDRDHYLDWILSGLESSPYSKIPMWILIAQLYWKDLLSMRKTGRRLVTALLGHFTTIFHDPDSDVFVELSTRLVSLITPLMTSNPESFISPTTWVKFRDGLLASLPEGDEVLQKAYKSINLRNERLDAWRHNFGQSGRQDLVKILDSTLHTPFNKDLAARCWKAIDDRTVLLASVLEWCTSLHRPGITKIYVATSLLRMGGDKGLDITGSVLAFMDAPASPGDTPQKKLLYHLVSELVRSGHFSVPRYIQWLISRGGLSDASESDPDGPCATRLLVELPVDCLTATMRELRGTLLRRVGYNIKDETADFEVAVKCFKHSLGLSLEAEDLMRERKPIAISKLCRRLRLSSRALQTYIGKWLQGILVAESDEKADDGKELELSSSTFDNVRSILEAAEDFAMLADVLKTATSVCGPDILTLCADTVNVHLHTFAGTGSAMDFFAPLLEKLKGFGDPPPRPLLAAMASLAQRLPGIEATAAQLRAELVRCDRSNMVGISSPASDNMVAQLQDAEGDLHEEIEKLRAGNTSVDRQTMDRLFGTVVDRLETYWAKSNYRQRVCNSLLTSLRAKDPKHFDLRMGQWVKRVINLQVRPPLTEVLPLLVSLGCVSPALILTSSSRETSQTSSSSASSNINPTAIQEVLQLLTMPIASNSGMTPEECYRFYIYQKTVQSQHRRELLTLVRDALVEYGEIREDPARPSLPLDDPGCQDRLLDLLRLQTLADANAVAEVLGVQMAEPTVKALIGEIATKLLVPGATAETKVSIDQILELADEFTLPFCQAKLSLVFKLGDPPVEMADPQEGQVFIFARAMDRAIDAKKLMWTDILPCLGDDVAMQLKSRARSRFFELLPSLKSPHADPTSEETIHKAESLLLVVKAMIHGRPPPKTSQLIAPMIDKLTELWQMLAAPGEDKRKIRCAALDHWIPAFLTFITFHATTAEPAAAATPGAQPGSQAMKPPPLKPSDDVRARLLLVLSGLILELKRVDPRDHQDAADLLAQRAFDLALHLADGLPEDSRSTCVSRLLTRDSGSSPSDRRLRYLFSYTAPPLERFMLARRDPAAVAAAAASAGNPPGRDARPGPEAWFGMTPEKLTPFPFKRWELLSEFTPNIGENDTSLNLKLFEAVKLL